MTVPFSWKLPYAWPRTPVLERNCVCTSQTLDDASGRSPAAWTPEYFHGGGVPTRGWNSVTVPGAVSAWVELHAKFGKRPFARIFEPAIGYGRNGFLVSPTIASQWGGPGAD